MSVHVYVCVHVCVCVYLWPLFSYLLKCGGWGVVLVHCCGVQISIFQQAAAHRDSCSLRGIDGQKQACRCRSDSTWTYWYCCKPAKIWFDTPSWFRGCCTGATQQSDAHFSRWHVMWGYRRNQIWTLNSRKMQWVGVICCQLFRLVCHGEPNDLEAIKVNKIMWRLFTDVFSLPNKCRLLTGIFRFYSLLAIFGFREFPALHIVCYLPLNIWAFKKKKTINKVFINDKNKLCRHLLTNVVNDYFILWMADLYGCKEDHFQQPSLLWSNRTFCWLIHVCHVNDKHGFFFRYVSIAGTVKKKKQ